MRASLAGIRSAIETIIEFPQSATLEGNAQGDRREFWLMVANQGPPERQRKILNEAVAFGFLKKMDAEIFLDALNLMEV